MELPVIQPGGRTTGATPVFEKIGIVGLGLIGGSIALASRQVWPSSLVIGAVVVRLHDLSDRTLGLVMGFGAGVLISAVSFELVEESVDVSGGLGATALRALTGKAVPVMKTRGTVIAGPEGLPVFATVHPSYLLRIPDEAGQKREYARFIEDLRAAHAQVA